MLLKGIDETHFRSKFTERHCVQTHGIAMGTKMAVAFPVTYMADLEKRLLAASPYRTWGFDKVLLSTVQDIATPCSLAFSNRLSGNV